MKTLAVVIGNRTQKEFDRVIRELKQASFTYNIVTKEWSRSFEDDKVDFWVTQLKQAGIACYLKEESIQ